MLRQRWSRNVDKWLKAIIYTSVIVVAVVSFSQKVDPIKFADWPIALDIIKLGRRFWWVAPLFTGVGAAAKLLSGFIGPPVLWSTIQFVLDQYQEEMFSDEGKPHHHRITLYQHVGFYWRLWPFGGWMIPVARSGYTSKSRIPKFKANDSAPDKAEGVAGQAYVQKKPIPIKDLPDINGDSPTEEDLEKYAARTFVSRKWLDKRLTLSKRREKTNARSFLGIQIRVKGEPWGVIVVDSQDATGAFIDKSQKSKRCNALIDVLGTILAKGKK